MRLAVFLFFSRSACVLPLAVIAIIGSASDSQAAHIASSPCRVASACAGHEFWPKMTLGDVQKTPQFGGGLLGGKPGNSDELLGWHGSDTLFGGDKADVLWADHVGTGQPATQRDRVYGGAGNDFIYSSRGRNTIKGGSATMSSRGYGKGTVDCGPGRDIVHLPRKRRRNWTFISCERFEYRSEAATGRGLKPLP